MTEEKPSRSRFGRIRGIGENVTDAVQAVTGHSAAEDIAEFTEAYTEVLTGLHDDVALLSRRVAQCESQSVQSSAGLRSDVARLERSTRIAQVLAAVAVIAGIVAVALAAAI
ncbi:MAG: hypothetical protein O3B04_02095 [Chloroflexi bacterium]|nr:hypothetical protein [Chloroflexota bacterium]MDA1296779.1 hypothetical protein [Chloroflexota bacterium]